MLVLRPSTSVICLTAAMMYIGDFGFEYNRLSSLSIPSFVKKINMDAFMQDGTNASLTDLQFEEGIECIAGGIYQL